MTPEMLVQWFNRCGEPFTGCVYDVKTSKGMAKHSYVPRCSRCGGAGGSDKWKFTGWTCFDCGGSGRGPKRTESLYTAERLAKLNAAQAKREIVRATKSKIEEDRRIAERREKWQAFRNEHSALVEVLARHAERQEEGLENVNAFLADLGHKMQKYGSLSAAQIEAAENSIATIEAEQKEREQSQHIGRVGERITVILTVEHIVTMEGFNPVPGYGRTACYCYLSLCRDNAGNRVVYKGSHTLCAKGGKITVKATVKDHSEYKGERQTVIARPKVLGEWDDSASAFMVWDFTTNALIPMEAQLHVA